MPVKVKYLIVDSGAFIKQPNLSDLCENIIICEEVRDELKNQDARNRFALLEFKITYREPQPESNKFVAEFAKKTGDYSALSKTDLKLLALTFELTKLHNSSRKLHEEPLMNDSKLQSKNENVPMVGFFNDEAVAVEENNPDEASKKKDEFAGSWITPQNLSLALEKMGIEGKESEDIVPVACITGDFAMQNVLKQINLDVLSIDGKCVTSLRQWALRCFGCFEITMDFSKRFCPKCGHATLKRVSYSIDENGNKKYYISKKKRINTKGTIFSLPAKRGGKHEKYPVLSEDQPRPQNKPSKKSARDFSALDDDFIARDSPFVAHDVTSRAAHVGVRRRFNAQDPLLPQFRRVNPNSNRRRKK